MKTIAAIVVLMISTAALATAETGVVCHKTDEYTDVCRSTDGLITEMTAYPDGNGSSLTYTPQEWKEHLARRAAAEARRNRWTAQKSVDSCLSGYAHDTCVRISTACEGSSSFTKTQCRQVSDYLNKASQ
jgi:hypothetical protein